MRSYRSGPLAWGSWNTDTGRTPCEETQGKDDLYQLRGAAWQMSVLHGPQKEPVLPTPWRWTSGLQNCEGIHFCGLSHSVCATLLRRPQDPDISAIIFFLPWKPVWGWYMPGVVNGQGYDHHSVQEGDFSLLSTRVLACKVLSVAVNEGSQSVYVNVSKLDLCYRCM